MAKVVISFDTEVDEVSVNLIGGVTAEDMNRLRRHLSYVGRSETEPELKGKDQKNRIHLPYQAMEAVGIGIEDQNVSISVDYDRDCICVRRAHNAKV